MPRVCTPLGEYSTATAAHVKVAAALRFATLQDKLALTESLKLELEALDEIRRAMRDAVLRHEGTHVVRATGG